MISLLRLYVRKLLIESLSNAKKPKILFMGGLPGSGKSTVVDNIGLDALFTTANMDTYYEAALKREGVPLDIQTWMREYSDMKSLAELEGNVFNTAESQRYEQLKDWSKKQSNLMFREALPMFQQDLVNLSESGTNILIDGTAANGPKIISQIKGYEEMGYDVGMIMVNIEPKVAQERNIARGQKGGRSLPKFAISRTAENLDIARDMYRSVVDPYWEIDNMGTYEEYVNKIVELRQEILEWVHS